MIPYVLTPEDEEWARQVAHSRIAMATGDPRFAYREGRSGYDTHTLGAMAELAAARVIGIEWPARVNTFRQQPDLDPFWEVRWSQNPKKVKVAVDDPPDFMVLHVTGRPPALEVVGFILAGWVQRNISATDPGERGWAAHFVHADRLSPIDPGFHSNHGWTKYPPDSPEWICLYCGVKFDG